MAKRTRKFRAYWSEEEIELLKEAYRTWPPRYELLPHITDRQCIHSKAYRLGLTRARTVERMYSSVTDAEWAWLAGFFDGEGTAFINQGERKSIKASYRQALVHVCNTHLATMEWIRERWPGGSWGERPVREGERRLPLYTIKWTRHGTVDEILTGMYPYLRVKREAADEVLAYVRRRIARE